MGSNRPLIETVPPPGQIRARLSDALREAELLRKLLKVAEAAEHFRQCDRKKGREGQTAQ